MKIMSRTDVFVALKSVSETMTAQNEEEYQRQLKKVVDIGSCLTNLVYTINGNNVQTYVRKPIQWHKF